MSLKQPIINLRKFINIKKFIEKPEKELKEIQLVLQAEAQKALEQWEDKKAAAQFWNDQFTGNYGD